MERRQKIRKMINMIQLFQEYLDSFYIAISGAWCLTQKEIKEVLKPFTNNTLETSLPSAPPVIVNMYQLGCKLPIAPFRSNVLVNNYIKKQAQLLIITCYESLKAHTNWPQIKNIAIVDLTFFHIRNAAAHNNHFYVKRLRGLPVQWKNKTIEPTTHGKVLFFDWMAPGDIEYFLEDVSKEIITAGIPGIY